jgi:hypothetical protein
MEVEFLSNMRYSLLASEEQWQEWQKKLGKFWTYCDAAGKVPAPYPSPGMLANYNLSSPPNPRHSSPPAGPNLYPPTSFAPNWNNSYAGPLISPLPTMPDLDMGAKKRSYDGDTEDPPAKRITRPAPGPMPSFTPNMPPLRQDAPRLPVPNLTISTSQPYSVNHNGANGYVQHAPLLPPLSGRAMSSVFPPTTPTWTQQLPTPQLPMLTPTGPHHNGTHNGNGYSTPSRRTSPHSVHDLLSLGSSPVSANYQNFNSPSFYLQQRASPYKPVRHVNTLLYPPPSASMHDYSSVPAAQMHYQPLGKRNDYRQGVAYPPNHQQWTLPQPNFHA